MPELLTTIQALRDHLAPFRGAGAIGLVPTMGALHAGHASLIDRARSECSKVVVTIFVNPLQFDRKDDLAGYPRQLDADLALCAAHGVDAVFAPDAREMYRTEPVCTIDVGPLADHLCGARRPGHFRGVATVVMKLFQIAQADRAYFGEKDAQQLAIIRRLAADFNVPTAVVPVATLREADGLAMSSRNQLLSADERKLAPVLYQAIRSADKQIAGGARDAGAIITTASAEIPADSRIRLEYLEIVDPDDLRPVSTIQGPVLVAGALWVGSTRLIDNVTSIPQERS